MLHRWLPNPWLSAFLWLTWLLLNQSWALGHVLMGAFLAWLLPYQTRRLVPYTATVSRPWAVLRLAWRVAVDIVTSNLAVAKLVLARRDRHRYSGFMEIPLDVRHPYALAALACILTGCPGTVWAGLTEDGSILTLHVLDLHDEAVWVDIVKHRYESLLIEIFESGQPRPERQVP